jgi:hypothetical protein
VRKQKPGTGRRDVFRDGAAAFLAHAFHEECSFDLRDPAVYRKELLGFLRVALKAGGFKAPEPRKTWSLLGRTWPSVREPRDRDGMPRVRPERLQRILERRLGLTDWTLLVPRLEPRHEDRAE